MAPIENPGGPSQTNPPKKGCFKNLAVGCLGMIVGSVFVICIEVMGASSLIGTLSTALLGSSEDSSGSSSSNSYDSGDAPQRNTQADERWEWLHRREEEKREKDEQDAKDARSAEDEAKRQQTLQEAHDKLAEPSKPW